jgi:hypothetical protein
VSGVVSALSLSENQVVDTAMSALTEGVLYTAIGAIPEVGGILGNVFETIWNVVAASGHTGVTMLPTCRRWRVRSTVQSKHAGPASLVLLSDGDDGIGTPGEVAPR